MPSQNICSYLGGGFFVRFGFVVVVGLFAFFFFFFLHNFDGNLYCQYVL